MKENLDQIISKFNKLSLAENSFLYKTFKANINLEFGVFGKEKNPCIGMSCNNQFEKYEINENYKIIKLMNAKLFDGQKLLIVLTDSKKIDIFKKLYYWMSQDLEINPNLIKSFKDLSKYIDQYSKLFEREYINEITHESLLGLYGELDVLRNLLNSKKYSKLDILNSWTGYYRSKHDFNLPNLRLEVKSSLNNNFIINSSSSNQLKSTPGFDTFLIYQSFVETNDHSSIELNDLIKLIFKMLKNNEKAKKIFEKKLDIFGIEKVKKKLNLSKLSSQIYEIRDDFPSIDHQKIHSSISDIKYKIDLSMCSEWLTEFKINEL